MPLVPTGDPDVFDHPEAYRYEVHSDNRVAGFASYRPSGNTTVFTHTEIDPAFEGQGLGSKLAQAALDDVRRGQRTIEPVCPFIAAYIERHPQYADLVVAG